jgi:hypothetical protein
MGISWHWCGLSPAQSSIVGQYIFLAFLVELSSFKPYQNNKDYAIEKDDSKDIEKDLSTKGD